MLNKGDRIAGRYRLVAKLGKGGMGEVWEAVHEVTDRHHALKFLMGDEVTSAMKKRFMREAKAASMVDHPNVIHVQDVFEVDDTTAVMVMDLLEGETLAAVITRAGSLNVETAAGYLLPVASAVGAAHERGIVHRDLKPENIFLVSGTKDPSEAVRVLDFGVAKVQTIDARSQGGVTTEGQVIGTPYYMSYEQAMGEGGIDHRADVWSFGVILCEVLTGRRPLEFETLGEMYTKLLQEDVPAMATLAPHLPDDLCDIIDRCLRKDRDERLSDLREIAEVLSDYSHVQVPAFGAPGRATRRGARDSSEEGGDSVRISTRGDDPVDPLDVTHPSVPGDRPLPDIPSEFEIDDDEPLNEAVTRRARKPEHADIDGDASEALGRVGDAVRREMAQAVSRAVSKRGTAGRVSIRRNSAELKGSGPTVAIDLGDWVEQWNLVPEEMRERRANEAATRLIKARKAELPQKRGATPWGPLLRGAVVVAVIAGAAVMGWRFLERRAEAERQAAAAASAPRSESRDERGAREARSCDAARKRIWQSGSMAGLSTEGWLVVLWLAPAKGELEGKAKLQQLVSDGKLTQAAHAELSTLTGGSARVVDAAAAPPGSVFVELQGDYVFRFLQTKGRAQFEQLAATMVAASGADYGALYARCAHLEVHDLGAWYYGRDRPKAAAALLYAAGMFADPPALSGKPAAADAALLAGLADKATGLGGTTLEDTIRAVGGRLADRKDGGASSSEIRFPLGGPTRATLASRKLAGKLGG
jgi:serine/threonine-protein kinase